MISKKFRLDSTYPTKGREMVAYKCITCPGRRAMAFGRGDAGRGRRGERHRQGLCDGPHTMRLPFKVEHDDEQ